VPVVRVQDLRCPLGVELAGRQMGADPAEQRKSLQVVAPFRAVGRLVRAARAAIEIGRIDHINGDMAVRHVREPQADPGGAEDRPEIEDGPWVQHGIRDRGQARQQQPDIGAGADQRLGQRPDDIGETAGLDERKDLGGDMEDLHAPHSRASISGVTSVMPEAVR